MKKNTIKKLSLCFIIAGIVLVGIVVLIGRHNPGTRMAITICVRVYTGAVLVYLSILGIMQLAKKKK